MRMGLLVGQSPETGTIDRAESETGTVGRLES